MEKETKKKKRKDDRGMDAQVLLLMDPGAELGWAELSDTLPSAGGERKHTQGHRVQWPCQAITMLLRMKRVSLVTFRNARKALSNMSMSHLN